MGRFSTERKLLLNETLRGFFCNNKLIGEEYDPESMQNYSNQVMNIFFNNKLVFFPNSQRIIEDSMIQSVDILDSVIIINKITLSEMPVVQLLALLLEHVEVFEQLKKELNMIYSKQLFLR